MSSNNIYRNNAEDCLRMAQTAVNDGDRPSWLTLAQSWLRLAERAAGAKRIRRTRPSAPRDVDPPHPHASAHSTGHCVLPAEYRGGRPPEPYVV
jgi:hypothetical protein